jgi:5-methylcytosine-specific restriction endonuclease McrA
MRKIADKFAKRALVRLEKNVVSGNISATCAWSVYSKPDKALSHADKYRRVSEPESVGLKALAVNVKKILKAKVGKRCAYCKRAMGQHAMSWNIEHILGKTKNPKLMFDMDNLTYACLDCNLVKNNEVDQKSVPFDIINPNSINFRYGNHLGFLQISTDTIHLLKYNGISTEGKSTYTKLKFDRLENLELFLSLNDAARNIAEQIDDRLTALISAGQSSEIASFLQKIKFGLIP